MNLLSDYTVLVRNMTKSNYKSLKRFFKRTMKGRIAVDKNAGDAEDSFLFVVTTLDEDGNDSSA